MKFYKNIFLITIILFFSSCKSELEVANPNQPTLDQLTTEDGILAYALGGVYYGGFKYTKSGYVDGVPGYFWAGAMGFHEAMGDVITAEAANWFMNQIGCPDVVTLDDGTKVLNPGNPNDQYSLVRAKNAATQQASNPIFHEWGNMYNLNNSCNTILANVDKITFLNGNADIKKNTLKAWAYWWKGFAYAHIGSIYYAGIINNDVNATNNTFVTKEALIAESNSNFDKAATILNGLTATGDYTGVMTRIIPDFLVKGKGGILSPAQWIRTINTYKARNLLVNTPVASMTAAQWQTILTLTSNGVGATDLVFTARTNANGDIWSATNGVPALKATGTVSSTGTVSTNTYRVSERLMQDFKAGDLRLTNNFGKGNVVLGDQSRGNTMSTRWVVLDSKDGSKGLIDSATKIPTIIYSSLTANVVEWYIASSYEENELMKAEAKIYTGDIEGGLASIDAVRKAQGSGLKTVTGTSLTLDQTKEELRRERRIGLLFRWLSFYDARRLGITDKTGPGRKGCVVVDKTSKVNTNATINYNYLDYWDVPDNELFLNPAAAGSAPTSNPKK